MSDTKTTIDHDTIKKWAEARGGKPATVEATGDADDPGVLRIAFDDGANLTTTDWDTFFKAFDEDELAFLYQEKTKDGSESRFCKFVKR